MRDRPIARVRRFIIAVALPAGLALLVPSAAPRAWAADDPDEGRTITRVVFEAPAWAAIERAREAIRSREGDRYSAAQVQKDIASLSALGIFADVSARTTLVPRGLVLTFVLSPVPTIRDILFEGCRQAKEEKLREGMFLRPGDRANPYRLKLDLEAVRRACRDLGFLLSSVEQELRKTDRPEESDLVYIVQEGPRLRIESVQFEGNRAISDGKLRKEMASVAAENPYLFQKSRYDPDLLAGDLRAARDLFHRKGYLDATVGHELRFDEAKERAYLVVHVREGNLYRVSDIEIRNAYLYRPEELLAEMRLRAGDPFVRDILDQDLDKLEKLYRRHGYAKVRITPVQKPEPDKAVIRLVLNVEEGPLCVMDRILIRGNRRTKEHVIRRELSLFPGERFDGDQQEESKRRLLNTGLFGSGTAAVPEPPVRIRLLDTGDPTRVDAVVEVNEGAMGQATIGAAWSSATGVMGNLSLSLINFDALDFPKDGRDFLNGTAWTGGAQTLKLSLSPGTQYRDYRLTWLNPSIWDSPYHAGFDAYVQDSFWPDLFDMRTIGFALRFGRAFFRDFRVSLSPRIEGTKVRNIDSGAPPDAFAARGHQDIRALGVNLSYDKRDSYLLPSRGYRIAGNLEAAGGAFGGDIKYFRETLEAQKWWTLWDQIGWGKHVFSVGARGGMVHGPDGDSVPIFERFFIGSIGSLRGFRYRRVGPIDPGTGKHIGGEYMTLGSAEYVFPIVPTIGDDYDPTSLRNILRGVFFVDAGAIENSVRDFRADHIRSAAGGGIRLRIPQLGLQEVPIAFYLAWPLHKVSTDRTETFSFTIGTGFAF